DGVGAGAELETVAAAGPGGEAAGAPADGDGDAAQAFARVVHAVVVEVVVDHPRQEGPRVRSVAGVNRVISPVRARTGNDADADLLLRGEQGVARRRTYAEQVAPVRLVRV